MLDSSIMRREQHICKTNAERYTYVCLSAEHICNRAATELQQTHTYVYLTYVRLSAEHKCKINAERAAHICSPLAYAESNTSVCSRYTYVCLSAFVLQICML